MSIDSVPTTDTAAGATAGATTGVATTGVATTGVAIGAEFCAGATATGLLATVEAALTFVLAG